MVSAAKMRKAIESVLRTRTYANLAWETVLNLSRSLNIKLYPHPIFTKRKTINKVAIVLIASNRGLCGGFNSAIINKVHRSIQKYQKANGNKAIDTDIILLGRKGASVYRNFGYNIAADFPKMDLTPEFKEVVPVAEMVIEGFLSKKYDKVMVAFTDFVSSSVQIPKIRQLLPIDIESQKEHLGIVGEDTRVGLDKEFVEEKEKEHLDGSGFKYEYIFEPNAEEVLNEMVPRLIEIQLFQALLESNASEHSARMNAMHKATEAASDMVKELTLFYNKARQAGITAEIAEIAAGAEALKK